MKFAYILLFAFILISCAENSEINVILLYNIENIKTLTKTNPESALFESFLINYKSSKRSKYKFFEFVFP